MTVELGEEKVTRYSALAAKVLAGEATVAEARSLVGKLGWAAVAVWGISTHSRPIRDWLQKIDAAGCPDWFRAHPDKPARAALHWIIAHIRSNNGLAAVVGNPAPTQLATADARGVGGAPVSYGGLTMPADVPAHVARAACRTYSLTHAQASARYDDVPAQTERIEVHEAYAALLLFREFPELNAQRVSVQGDNAAASKLTRTLRGPPGHEEMQRVALLLFAALTATGARITEHLYVPGKQNEMADALSRGQLARFHALLHAYTGGPIP